MVEVRLNRLTYLPPQVLVIVTTICLDFPSLNRLRICRIFVVNWLSINILGLAYLTIELQPSPQLWIALLTAPLAIDPHWGLPSCIILLFGWLCTLESNDFQVLSRILAVSMQVGHASTLRYFLANTFCSERQLHIQHLELSVWSNERETGSRSVARTSGKTPPLVAIVEETKEGSEATWPQPNNSKSANGLFLLHIG